MQSHNLFAPKRRLEYEDEDNSPANAVTQPAPDISSNTVAYNPRRRLMWGEEDNSQANAKTQVASVISFNTAAYSEDDAFRLIQTLMQEQEARGEVTESPALALLKVTHELVNAAINNNLRHIRDKIGSLINLLEHNIKTTGIEKGQAFYYCIRYLRYHLDNCAALYPQFRASYEESALKRNYLDKYCPPPHAQQRHGASPHGSPTKG